MGAIRRRRARVGGGARGGGAHAARGEGGAAARRRRTMPDDTLARTERWARFRFSVIGGLLASPPAGGDLQAALRALADRPYQHPLRPGERVPLGFSTIERWYYQSKDRA